MSRTDGTSRTSGTSGERRDWADVRALFHRVLDCTSSEQEALLRAVGATDAALAREVASLLAAHAAAEGFLDRSESGSGEPASERAFLKPGDRLGTFEIVAVAGRGGMGEVYQARDLRLGRLVALKVIPHRYAGDARARTRFEQEARAIANLSHPHICTLHDVGAAAPAPGEAEVPFLVMEFLEGRTLAERLKDGPVPPAEALRYALALADALDAAHACGIVHRDFKPANIMLTATGVKLLDFGLAQLRTSGGIAAPEGRVKWQQEQWETGAGGARGTGSQPAASGHAGSSRRERIAGTLRYMSPEQLRGERTDQRSDIFAFGVVLYEMLTGRPPFDAPDDSSVVAAVLTAPAPRIDVAGAASLATIVTSCLEKAPHRRWAHMREVQAALRCVNDASRDQPALASLTSLTSLTPQTPFASLRSFRALASLTWLSALTSRTSSASTSRRPSSSQASPGPRTSHHRRRLTRTAAAAAAFVGLCIVLVVVVTALQPSGSSSPSAGAARVAILAPEGVRFNAVQVSPDGRHIAFIGWTPGGSRIWMRALDAVSAQPVRGTDGAIGPLFWSPDSRQLAFVHDDNLRALDTVNGTTRTIGVVGQPFSGTWSTTGVILVDAGKNMGGGLLSLPASGGGAVELLRPNRGNNEAAYLFPHFLPDGQKFLFAVHSQDPLRAGVYVSELDGRAPKRLLPQPTPVSYVQSGHLLFVFGNTLMAQAFDADAEVLLDDPMPIVRAGGATGPRLIFSTLVGASSFFSASQTGTIAYAISPTTEQLTWFDRAGQRQQSIGDPGAYVGFALSPDATRIVVSRSDGERQPWNLWLIDTLRGATSRLTSAPSHQHDPRWSPDGRRLAVASTPAGPIHRKKSLVAIDLDGRETALDREPSRSVSVDDWSPDGRYLLYHVDRDRELLAVPVTGKEAPTLIWRSPSANAPDQARFSPDGRWVAYHAQDSGRAEVYVTRFPRVDSARPDHGRTGVAAERWQVSIAGGVQPMWRTDGRELYYLGLDGRLYAVSTNATGHTFEPETPRLLFQTAIGPSPYVEQYAVDATGTRFLLLEPDPRAQTPIIDVVLNWPAFRSNNGTR